MRLLIIFFLCLVQLRVFAQFDDGLLNGLSGFTDSSENVIELSENLSESDLGIWKQDDYQIGIGLQPFKEWLENECQSLLNLIKNTPVSDTANVARYKMYADRYVIAGNKVDKAKNGFDLKSMVLYIGPGNKLQNNNSSMIDYYVRRLVEEGNAVVYYKGKRIYSLKRQFRWDMVVSTIKIYYDQKDNYVYNYIGHINW